MFVRAMYASSAKFKLKKTKKADTLFGQLFLLVVLIIYKFRNLQSLHRKHLPKRLGLRFLNNVC